MFCRPEEVTNPGPCPHCGDVVGGEMGHTGLATAFTPQARALLRMYGHLVVLAGTRWCLVCAKAPKDTHLWVNQSVAGKPKPAVLVAEAGSSRVGGNATPGRRRG